MFERLQNSQLKPAAIHQPRIQRPWPGWVRRWHLSLNLPDRLTLIYLLFASLLLLLRPQYITHQGRLLFIHFLLMGAIVWLAQWRAHGPRLSRLLSYWYPLLLPGFFFEEIGQLVHAIFPGWFDQWLIAADYALFGAHPTVWIEQFSSYHLTEFLQLTYTMYLPLVPGFGLLLWWRGQQAQFTKFTAALCLTYYLNYVIFVLFPIEGPHHTLAHLQQVELTGGPVTAFINLIEKYGRVHGGAFPSNHVAGSMIVLFSACRFSRRWGYALAPLVLSICLATVYGRYHYVVDVIAGTLMAALGCQLIWRVSNDGRSEKVNSPRLQ